MFCCESEIEKERPASIHGFVMDSLLSLFLVPVFSSGLVIKGSFSCYTSHIRTLTHSSVTITGARRSGNVVD